MKLAAMTMTVRTIREKMHDYIAAMPDETLTALYTVLQREVDALAGAEEDRLSEAEIEEISHEYARLHPEKTVSVDERGAPLDPARYKAELDRAYQEYIDNPESAVSEEELDIYTERILNNISGHEA